MIALIAAFAKNQVIGYKGHIPWKISGEQRRFKELTTGNVVIMGRRSYEEIGKPLPNRTTIVVSNTAHFDGKNCFTAKSLMDAYFPPFESGQFVKEVNERFEGEIPYTYVTYTRKQGNIE